MCLIKIPYALDTVTVEKSIMEVIFTNRLYIFKNKLLELRYEEYIGDIWSFIIKNIEIDIVEILVEKVILEFIYI